MEQSYTPDEITNIKFKYDIMEYFIRNKIKKQLYFIERNNYEVEKEELPIIYEDPNE